MIDVTQPALERISYLLEKESKKFFRISVVGGGCSGFKYDMNFDDQQTENDILISKGGVNLLIDDISMPFLAESLLDYEETLSSSEFKIINPQATAKCGCGSSFSV